MSSRTPIYQWPYPTPAEPSDGPFAFQAALEAVEATVRKIDTSPSWYTRRTTRDPYASGAFAALTAITLPASAPAGRYLVNTTAVLFGSVATTGTVRVQFGAQAALDSRADLLAGTILSYTHADQFTHTGGAATITLSHQATAGTPNVDPGTTIAITYLGA
jgi:hypothetical protein